MLLVLFKTNRVQKKLGVGTSLNWIQVSESLTVLKPAEMILHYITKHNNNKAVQT